MFGRPKTIQDGLARTRQTFFGRIRQLLAGSTLTPDTWDELEELLIQADVGVEITTELVDDLRRLAEAGKLRTPADVDRALRERLIAMLQQGAPSVIDEPRLLTVILVVGVNGSGKTTTIAKLARQWSDQGKRVLLAAADTFRAAAVDQLQVWAERLDLPVIAGQPGADPGAVAYDAIQASLARKMDIVLVDTAGRLHTRYNLMEELKKVYRVVGKALPGAPHATWLVLDATTGQNALQQARAFKEAVNVTGVILAKLDSSARGGMAFAIQEELGLPILYAGLGERPEDLQPFNPEAFVDGILAG